MAGDSFALNSLGEIIFAILFVTVLSSFFIIAHNPNLLYSELETTEIAAISTIIPKDSSIIITLDTNRELVISEENTFVISVDEEYSENEFRKIPKTVTIEQQENKIILT